MSTKARLPLAVALLAGGLLVTGWQAGPAAHATTSPSRTPGGICTKTARGTVANCPRPVSRGLLPQAAISSKKVTSPVADPATFLDTRT